MRRHISSIYPTSTGRWRRSGSTHVSRRPTAPSRVCPVRVDAFGLYAGGAILVAAALVLLMSLDYTVRRGPGLARPEYCALVLLATSGMMLLAVANDLVVLFLALEAFSLALYILAGYAR